MLGTTSRILPSTTTRDYEVRERIPVLHDNYFQSFFSSRHAARVLNFVPMTARSSFTFVIKVSVITARCVRCVDVECSLHEIVYFSSLFSQFTDVSGFISNEYTRKTSRFFEKKTR